MVGKNLLQNYLVGPQNQQDNHKFHGNIFKRENKTMKKEIFGSKKVIEEEAEDPNRTDMAFNQNPLLPKINFGNHETDNSVAI